MIKNRKNDKLKLCLISSSGGHWEQLQRLKPLLDKYEGFFVCERTKYETNCKYKMKQSDLKDKFLIPKMIFNMIMAIYIWHIEKPDFIITTGTLVAYPFYLLARINKKKFIFIESFAVVHKGTKAGNIMYKHSDLFIVQWESLKKIYPNAVYGGCIY